MNYESLVENEAGTLVKTIVADIGAKKAVDVSFEFLENDQWSVVRTYMGEQADELALRFHSGGSFELYVGYYDDEDELQEVTRMLTPDEVKEIPSGLQKVMMKVALDEAGLRVPGNVLAG
jgi:hypothetical protein